MKVILVSSIPGLNIADCVDNFINYADEKGTTIKYYKIEGDNGKRLISSAENILSDSGVEKYSGEGYTFSQALALPFNHLSTCCNNAFRATLDAIQEDYAKAHFDIAVMSLHSILFHQQTYEFANPYIASNLVDSLANYDMDVEWVVSFQDDIFDSYRNLLAEGQVLNPRIRKQSTKDVRLRKPIKDIKDLRFILGWRDSELNNARNMAIALKAKHLLFHKKGRLKSLYNILINDDPIVYFSHPISQPRRDILEKKDAIKSKEPNVERGKEFVRNTNRLANVLGRRLAILEPTAIDEYRIDFDHLKNLTAKDFKDKVMPPLSERWPISQGDRLGTLHIDETTHKLLAINPIIYGTHYQFDDCSLDYLESATETLLDEIKRQINVRDHILAMQSSLIVAYRPYSLPSSPDPTGGVSEEIDSIVRKIKMNERLCSPAIIIIHTKEDEIRRRHNEFEYAWSQDFIKNLLTLNDEGACNGLKEKIIEILADLDLKVENCLSALVKYLKDKNINLPDIKNRTSMPEGELAQRDKLRLDFAKSLFENTAVMKSPLQAQAEEYEEIEFIYDDDKFHGITELIKDINTCR